MSDAPLYSVVGLGVGPAVGVVLQVGVGGDTDEIAPGGGLSVDWGTVTVLERGIMASVMVYYYTLHRWI